eukprot:TRINITY_DN4129_c0_g1_i2.p1 TRINITY_DN4129_c0_g1~~TRINITY_DN4129_c0_g1_i2.p1  ORF type:complete len:648 (-),score=134.68 TRINITY_DN4129_c0_g1_i2:58-2001(-)
MLIRSPQEALFANEVFNATDASTGDLIQTKQFSIQITQSGTMTLTAESTLICQDETINQSASEGDVWLLNGYWSLIPPVATIFLALVAREVIPALFLGIWLGNLLLHHGNPLTATAWAIGESLPRAVDAFTRVQIMLLSLFLGGTVGIMMKSGGATAFANALARYATSSTKGQLSVAMVAACLFFDDYTNLLVTGNSMRFVTDKLRISRAKLAYIADSCSATMASLIPFSSWIGFELALINDSFIQSGIDRDPYLIFIQSLPSRFYPILTWVMVLTVIISKKEIGPMLQEERMARSGLQADQDSKKKHTYEKPRVINALIPLLTIIVVVIATLIAQGVIAIKEQQAQGINISISASTIFANTDSFNSLIWGTAAGSIVAILLVLVQRIMSLSEAMEAWIYGMKNMVPVLILLWFAWALGDTINQIKTAHYVVNMIGNSVNPGILPFLVTVVASILSFCTGTSWGVMVILFPLSVSLVQSLAPGNERLLVEVVASVLAGAVFGDHCSPIADTTILSAFSSGCPLRLHVKTQIPYALIVGGVGLLVGSLPVGMGLYPSYVGLLLSAIIIVAIVLIFGRSVGAYRPGDDRTDVLPNDHDQSLFSKYVGRRITETLFWRSMVQRCYRRKGYRPQSDESTESANEIMLEEIE